MKLTTLVKKTVITTTVSVAIFGSMSVHAAAKIITGVPHAFEFSRENPGGTTNYWCGHTALKIAMQYKTGVNKTLSQIDSVFKANSPQGYAKNTYCGSENPGKNWCAKLQDLDWAARLSQAGGYGRSSSALATSTERA